MIKLYHEINPDIPIVLSDIIMKLMSKTAEDRYQSAWGIKADMEKCLANLKDNNITYFTNSLGLTNFVIRI